MKRILILALLCNLAGCGVATYRDTVATSFGYLHWAIGEYSVQCKATPNAATCALITRGIAAHNVAVDALDGYCAGVPATGNASWTQGGPCAPIKGLQPALVAALAKLNPIIASIKMLATGKTEPKLTAEKLLEKPSLRASLSLARIEAQ